MTGAHDEKVIERALDIAVDLFHLSGAYLEETDTAPATVDEIKDFFIQNAYEELGYTKDDLGRWVKL